jgi:hypothetical protein
MLTKQQVELITILIDEAAKNLADLMFTPEAEKLEVRHFLPDELNGCAIILREAFDITHQQGDQP